ncbi:C-type mannose receptor 2-like [Tubulanus polymorphus]|uniref:C-type mannose receptor 2-like n=1 Tax=Tubulanus polymorphus TaxID=672921 RepID=UPI003DA3C9D6
MLRRIQYNFFIECFVIFLISHLGATTTPDKRGKCPKGKIQFGSSCYDVGFKRLQIASAKSQCVGNNKDGYLVEIGTEEEHYYLIRAITELLRKHPTNHIQFWTGGSRISSAWTWHSRVEGASAAVDGDGQSAHYIPITDNHFQDWRPFEPSQEGMEPVATMKVARNVWGWNDVYSDSRFCLRYICEKSLDKKMGVCEKRWHRFDDHCYYFSYREHLHAKAKRKCQERSSHLVSINSREENEFIKDQIRRHTFGDGPSRYEEWWIGAERFGGAGGTHWLWDVTDRITETYSKWLAVPDTSDRRLPLAYLVLVFYGEEWWWTTEFNWVRLPFICESAPDKIATKDHFKLRCYGEFKQFRRSCYLFVKMYFTRHQAEVNCMNRGGRLVSIKSKHEMKFLMSELDKFGPMKYNKWWTGGLYTDFKWMWSDEYQNIQGGKGKDQFMAWMSGEPNNFGGDEKHISLRMDFDEWGWNDVSGSGVVRIPYICEFPATPFSSDVFNQECMVDKMGDEYVGNLSVTLDETPCQRWDKQWPNRHSFVDSNFPDESVSDAGNHCRNPDKKPEGPWCFLSDTRRGNWMFCDVPLCSEVEGHSHGGH